MLNAEQTLVLDNLKRARSLQEMIDGLPRSASKIERGVGSFEGCLATLHNFHKVLVNLAWFEAHDLDAFKLQCHILGKLSYIKHRAVEPQGYASEEQLMHTLLSDDEELVGWAADMCRNVHPKITATSLTNNPRDPLFRHYQSSLALVGEWGPLAQRAERFLADPPKGMKRFAADHRFFLALAQADRPGMESALREITEPKQIKARRESLNEFNPFVVDHAMLYAKIAWRHGHELLIDSPLMVPEWLPVRPLASYPDPYPFMRAYPVQPETA